MLRCMLVLAVLILVPGMIRAEQQVSAVIEATSGTVMLKRRGDEMSKPRPVDMSMAVELYEGDRLMVPAGSSVDIFEGKNRKTITAPQEGPAVSYETPPPPPSDSIVARLLMHSAQSGPQRQQAGVTIRGNGFEPFARFNWPLRETRLLSPSPPPIPVVVSNCKGKAVALKISGDEGTALFTQTVPSSSGTHIQNWQITGETRGILAEQTRLTVQVTINDAIKDSRTFKMASADEVKAFTRDLFSLQTDIGVGDIGEMTQHATFDKFCDMYEVTPPTEIQNMADTSGIANMADTSDLSSMADTSEIESMVDTSGFTSSFDMSEFQAILNSQSFE